MNSLKNRRNLGIQLNILLFFKLFHLEEEQQLTWGWGFIGGPITTEEDPEGQSDFNSGCHSAETEIITDSEDDLFFLDGESATTYPCK